MFPDYEIIPKIMELGWLPVTFPSSPPGGLSSCPESQGTMRYSVFALNFQPPSVTEGLVPVWLISVLVNWEAL